MNWVKQKSHSKNRMAFHMLFFSLVAYVRQQCNVSCSLNCRGQFTLVICTSTGYPSRQDLCTICHALLQLCDILVVDLFNTIYAEHANLFPWSFIISRCSFHDGCSSNLHNCIFLMWYLFRKELRRRLKSLQNRLNHPTEWMHPEQASQRPPSLLKEKRPTP